MSGSLSDFGGMQGLGANGLGYYSQLINSPLYRGLMGAQPAAMGTGGTSLPAMGGGATGGGLQGGAAAGTNPLMMLLARQILNQGGTTLGLAPRPDAGMQQGQQIPQQGPGDLMDILKLLQMQQGKAGPGVNNITPASITKAWGQHAAASPAYDQPSMGSGY